MSLPGRLCFLIIPMAVAAALMPHVTTGGNSDRAGSDRVGKGEDYLATLRSPDSGDEGHNRELINGVMQRFSAKERVKIDLLARRISLLEAAARFRDLQLRGPPFDWRMWRIIMRNRFPNASEDECMCRCVLDSMDMMFSEGSLEALLVMGRLEAELHDHLRRGTLRLRPPAPTPAKTPPE
jgi:hypothetical protein